MEPAFECHVLDQTIPCHIRLAVNACSAPEAIREVESSGSGLIVTCIRSPGPKGTTLTCHSDPSLPLDQTLRQIANKRQSIDLHCIRPRLSDRAMSIVFNSRRIAWPCVGCMHPIAANIAMASSLQICPYCLTVQYPSPRNLGWRIRLHVHRTHRQELKDQRRLHRIVRRIERDRERAKYYESLREGEQARAKQREARVREAREHARSQERVQRQQAESDILNLALGIGFIADTSSADPSSLYRKLSPFAKAADELAEDIKSAYGAVATFDETVAFGRPASGVASALAAMKGDFIISAAFGVATLGARVVATDLKRAKASRLSAKWFRFWAELTLDEADLMTRIFVYRHPVLCRMLGLGDTTEPS